MSSLVCTNPNTDTKKANDLVKQAQQRLKSFSFFFNSASKYEDTIELYTKAAALYKLNKNWQVAGECYLHAADISCEKLKVDKIEVCQYYMDAAKAFKNVSKKEALRVYQLVVSVYMENNRFAMAAKIWKEIGEIQETELNIPEAMNAMQKAVDCFEADNNICSANATTACHVKIAQLAAEIEEYQKAIEIYENVSKIALESSSSSAKWCVKEWLFKALLCQFALDATRHDVMNVKNNVERYKDILPQFEGTRECKFIEETISAFDADDVEKYTEIVFRFDETCKLDHWSAKVLLYIKKMLMNGEMHEIAIEGHDNNNIAEQLR